MLRTIRFILNNINEKPYVRGKAQFKLYSDSDKNLTPLPKNSKEMQRINYLETEIRYDNLKVYAANMAKLRAKSAALIVAPILFGALTILSWANNGYDKTEVLPAYQKSVIVLDEEHLYQDDILPEIYYRTDMPRTFTNDSTAQNLSSSMGKAHINYGEGEKAVQVDFSVGSNGTWSVSDYKTEPYFNLEGKDSDKATEIPEKYQEIIEEASNIFKSQLKINSDTYNLIDEILSNNKNDIMVKIERYEKLGDIPVETHHSYWLWRTILIICDVVLACLLIYNRDELSNVKSLQCENGELDTGSYMSIIHAVMKYREALIQAETERINEIDSITKKNNGTGDILSKFEKRLIMK